jgi:hypothetical protein
MYCHSLHHKWLRWFWLFLTLAVLIKGVAGFFFLPGLALYALVQKHLKTLLYNKWLYAGLLFLIVVAGSYYALREWNAPGFLQVVYANELGGRYLQELEQNGQPLFFYFGNFWWRYPFWLYLLMPAFLVGLFSPSAKARAFSQFTAILSITYLLIISSSKTKLVWYDIPLYPLLALQVGWLLYWVWQWLQKQWLITTSHAVKIALGGSLFALLFAVPFRLVYQQITHLDDNASDREQAYFLQQAIRQKKDLNNHTFLYEDYDRHIRYYTNRLQAENVKVRLCNVVDEVKPGTYVVTSEDSTRQKLLQRYEVSQPVKAFGCDIYYIKNRLPEDSNLVTSKKAEQKKQS